jgi:hypothetical protein
MSFVALSKSVPSICLNAQGPRNIFPQNKARPITSPLRLVYMKRVPSETHFVPRE